MMTGRMSRVAGAACAGWLMTAGLAFGKTVTVVPGDEPVTVEVPSSWVSSEIKRGVEISTPDEEVMLWIESYIPAQFEKVLAEHNAYFKEQGVTITGEPEQEAKDFATYAVKFSTYPATYEGEKTVIRYISVGPKDESKRRILLSYWATTDGDKDYDADTSKIIASLKAAVEKQ